jgi:hypothetical protein
MLGVVILLRSMALVSLACAGIGKYPADASV